MYAIQTRSHAGEGSTNEDVFGYRYHPQSPSCCICVLADGQGGHAGGQRAAQLACSTIINAATALQPDLLSQPLAWTDLLYHADQTLYESPRAGLTTVVALCITPWWVCGASCGDSEALLMMENKAIFLTQHQTKKPPMGSGLASITPFGNKLKPQWLLLMMSDGVWKYAGWPRIKTLLSSHNSSDAIDQIEQLARLPGTGAFQDDFTLLLAQPHPTPPQP